MPRTPRWMILARDAAYHVISRGHNRETVFADDEDRNYFLTLLRRYRLRTGFRLYHYCLMSNHFHLLLQLDDPRGLSPMMAGLLRSYVHYHNRRHGFVGHLWQGRFKSPLIQRDEYWLSCGRYIERNPSAAGLCVEPWDYRWSSCRAYALGEMNDLVTEDPCYLELGVDAATRQQRWREILMGGDDREKALEQSDWAVGDDGFRERMAVVTGRGVVRRRGRPRKAATGETGSINSQADDD